MKRKAHDFRFNVLSSLPADTNALSTISQDHLALWHFREFNELPHVFERRIAKSYAPAAAYVKRFYSPSVAVASRGIAFIAGALVGVLVLITVSQQKGLRRRWEKHVDHDENTIISPQ